MTRRALRGRINSRADSGQARVAASTRRGGANVAARTNVAASWDDREAAERFSAAVVEFSAADLARAARRTKAAAKGWKDASRAPGLSSTINMARSIPAIRSWLLHEMGEAAEFESPEFLARVVAAIQRGGA